MFFKVIIVVTLFSRLDETSFSPLLFSTQNIVLRLVSVNALEGSLLQTTRLQGYNLHGQIYLYISFHVGKSQVTRTNYFLYKKFCLPTCACD